MLEINGKKLFRADEAIAKLEEQINKTYEKFKFIKYEDAWRDSKELAGEAFIEFLEFVKKREFLYNDFFDTKGKEYYWYYTYGPSKGEQNEN